MVRIPIWLQWGGCLCNLGKRRSCRGLGRVCVLDGAIWYVMYIWYILIWRNYMYKYDKTPLNSCIHWPSQESTTSAALCTQHPWIQPWYARWDAWIWLSLHCHVGSTNLIWRWSSATMSSPDEVTTETAPQLPPRADQVHACLKCQRAFCTRTAWSLHAFKKTSKDQWSAQIRLRFLLHCRAVRSTGKT